MHMLGIHSFESMYEPFLPEALLPLLDVLASSSDDDNGFTPVSYTHLTLPTTPYV